MKKTLLFLFFALLAITGAQADTSQQETAQQVHELFKRVEKIGDPRILSSGNLPEDYGKNYAFALKYLEKGRQLRNLRDNFQPFIEEVSRTYAPREQVWNSARTLNEKFAPLGLGYDVGDELHTVQQLFQQVDETLEANAELVLSHVQNIGLNETILGYIHEVSRIQAMEECSKLLSLAPRFAPDNQRIAKRASNMETQLASLMDKYKAKEKAQLAQAKWPGGNSSDAVAVAAANLLKTSPQWGGSGDGTQILKVASYGNWTVAERDLFGRPLTYGHPVRAAVRSGSAANGVVKIIEMTAITKGASQSPDFKGFWVGSVSLMLQSKLP